MTYEAKHFALPASYYYVVQIYSITNVIAYLIVGIGLIKTLRWARLLVIIWTVATFLYAMIFFFVYTNKHTIPYFINTDLPVHILYARPILAIIWVVFVLYYFNRKAIKVQFENNMKI